MTIQVLVSTMHQKDHSLLEKMNIQSDAIVVNQCDRNEIQEFEFRGNNIKWISLNERGVGLSRNTALMRATADIVLFADDDVTYVDNYKDIVIDSFKSNKRADILIFNVTNLNEERFEAEINKKIRIGFYNSLKYGTFRIAARTENLKIANVCFTLLFGGGAKYSCGEDSLFIVNCLQKGLKIFAIKENIGTVLHEVSTWFFGYNEKYFYDKGAFLSASFKYMKHIFKYYYCLKMAKLTSLPKMQILNLIDDGIKGYNKSISFEDYYNQFQQK
jgi:hypothetical protein